MGEPESDPAVGLAEAETKKAMKIPTFDDERPVRRALWDPRSYRMEETHNRALMLLDQLMDNPDVNIEAFKRIADICDEEKRING
jgi:hypothetical protein